MKKTVYLVSLMVFSILLIGCHKTNSSTTANITTTTTDTNNGHMAATGVFYEIFVRSFADSNGDGIGDLNGVTEKLDYLQDLGIKGIWLMPIFKSPSDHGYDVTDYYSINPQYGTMADFENLVNEAHQRGIKVILDFVINHTSSQNPWFIKSENGDPQYKDWYTWVSTSDVRLRYNANSWHTDSNGEEYFGYFGANMPDLNLSNPDVVAEIDNIGKFWLDKGSDGFRLDAAPYIFCNGERYPFFDQYNIDFWANFRETMRAYKPSVYLVGEVWKQNIDYYAQYYQGLDSTFNFDLADTIINSAKTGGGSYTRILNNDYTTLAENDPDFIDAPFLSNHDQIRSATQLNGDLALEKIAAEMLITLPGNPFIYYGEELGMQGNNSDHQDNKVRQPFIWGDSSITTTWYQDPFNDGLTPLSGQINDPNSLYSTYKNIIAVRNDNIALSQGKFYPYESDNARLQGFYRVYDKGSNKQLVLVLHNLSNKYTYDLPDLPGATLLYQSYGKDGYAQNKIDSSTTIILQLPYSDLSNYIE